MAEYKGSLSVMSGIAPEGAIPVVNAKDVWVESTGDGPSNFKSLADVLDEALGTGTGGSDYDDTELRQLIAAKANKSDVDKALAMKADASALSSLASRDYVNQQVAAVLPSVSSSDAGKFLRVSSSGEWVAETIPYAEGEEY